MMKHGRKFLQGTLETLVLKTLSWGPMHGYGIASWIEERTEDALRIEEGSLYPALYRMERRGWIEPEWRVTEKNRRAKYYRLTEVGEAQLRADQREWTRFAAAVATVLSGNDAPAWAM
jgi:transcriptional regulator